MGNCIYYYHHEADVFPCGVMFLTGSFVEPLQEGGNERKGYWGIEISRNNEQVRLEASSDDFFLYVFGQRSGVGNSRRVEMRVTKAAACTCHSRPETQVFVLCMTKVMRNRKPSLGKVSASVTCFDVMVKMHRAFK